MDTGVAVEKYDNRQQNTGKYSGKNDFFKKSKYFQSKLILQLLCTRYP